ncbi:MAG: 30S ribosomal protein S4 [archaeon]|nr:MAG: 30S ribosomal protein S4 [archaeon]
MGDPRKQKRKYEKPLRPWDQKRILEEVEILKKYGLRRKNEIYKAGSILRNFRRNARRLAAQKNEKQEKELIQKLNRLGLIEKESSLDDVLDLKLENILDRRLQTVVFSRGLAKTPKQARQFIVHGHVKVNQVKVKWPSFLVPKEFEKDIKLIGVSNE